jgi:hypothetical protein
LAESRQGTPAQCKTHLEAGVVGLGVVGLAQRRTTRNQSRFQMFFQVRICLISHKYQPELPPEAGHHTKHNCDNLDDTNMNIRNTRDLQDNTAFDKHIRRKAECRRDFAAEGHNYPYVIRSMPCRLSCNARLFYRVISLR